MQPSSARAERAARRSAEAQERAEELRRQAAARGADAEEQEAAVQIDREAEELDASDAERRATERRVEHAQQLSAQLKSAALRRCAGKAESAQRVWMFWMSSAVYQANRADADADAGADADAREDLTSGPDDLRRRSSGGFVRQKVLMLNNRAPHDHKEAGTAYAQQLYAEARKIVRHAGVEMPDPDLPAGKVEDHAIAPPVPANVEWADPGQIVWAYRDIQEGVAYEDDPNMLITNSATAVLRLAADWIAQFAEPPPAGGHYTPCPFYPLRLPAPARDAHEAQLVRAGLSVRRRKLQSAMPPAGVDYVAGAQPQGGRRRLQRDEFGLPVIDRATGLRLDQRSSAEQVWGQGQLRKVKGAAGSREGRGRFVRNPDGSFVLVPRRGPVVHATDSVTLVVRPIRLNEHHWEWQWARWLENTSMVEPASLLPHVRAMDGLPRSAADAPLYVEGSALAIPLMTPVPTNHLGVEVRNVPPPAAGAMDVDDAVRDLNAQLAPRPLVTTIALGPTADTASAEVTRLEQLLPRLWLQPDKVFATAKREGLAAHNIGRTTDPANGWRFCVVWQANAPGGAVPIEPEALVLFRKVEHNGNPLVFDGRASRASDCWHINAAGVPGAAYARLVDSIRRPPADAPAWHRHFYGEPLVRAAAGPNAGTLVDVRVCSTYTASDRRGELNTREQILGQGEQNRLYSEVHRQVCFAPLPMRTCATLPPADYAVRTAENGNANVDLAREAENLAYGFRWTLNTDAKQRGGAAADDDEDDDEDEAEDEAEAAERASARASASPMVPGRALGDELHTRGRYAPPDVHPRLRRPVGPLYPEVHLRRDHGDRQSRIDQRTADVRRALLGDRYEHGVKPFTDAEQQALEAAHPVARGRDAISSHDRDEKKALLAAVDAAYGFASPTSLGQALERFVRNNRSQLGRYRRASASTSSAGERLAPLCNQPGGLYVAARMDTGTGPGEGGVDSFFPMPAEATVYSLADVNMVRGVHEYLRDPAEPVPPAQAGDEWKLSRSRWGEPHWFKEEMAAHREAQAIANLQSEARASLQTLELPATGASSDARLLVNPMDRARTLVSSLRAVARDVYQEQSATATPSVVLHQRQRLDMARIGSLEVRPSGLHPEAPTNLGSNTAKLLWEAWNTPPATYRGGPPERKEPLPQYRMPARVPYFYNPQRNASMALLTVPEAGALDGEAATAAAVPGRPDRAPTRLPHQAELLAAPTPLSICPNRLHRRTRRSLFERMQAYDKSTTPDVGLGWRGQGVLREGMQGYVPPSADAPGPLMSATRDAAAEQRADVGSRTLVVPTYVLLLEHDDLAQAMRAGDRDWHQLMTRFPNYWKHADAFELLPYRVGDEAVWILRPNPEYIEPEEALPVRAEGTWETFDAPHPDYAADADVRRCTRPRERMRASWFRDRKLWGAPHGVEADETRKSFVKMCQDWETTYTFQGTLGSGANEEAVRTWVATASATNTDLQQLQHALRYGTMHLCWFAGQLAQEARASPPAPLPACVRDQPQAQDAETFNNYRILEELIRLSDFATNAYEVRWMNAALNEHLRRTVKDHNATQRLPTALRLSLRQRRCAGNPYFEAQLAAVETGRAAHWPTPDQTDALLRGAAPRYVALLQALYLQIPTPTEAARAAREAEGGAPLKNWRSVVRKATGRAIDDERAPDHSDRTAYTKRRYDTSGPVGDALDELCPAVAGGGGGGGSLGTRAAHKFVEMLLAYDPASDPAHVTAIAEPLLGWRWAPVLSAFLDACLDVMKRLLHHRLATFTARLSQQARVEHLFYYGTAEEDQAYREAVDSGAPPPERTQLVGDLTLHSSGYRRTPRRVRTTRTLVGQLDDPDAAHAILRDPAIQGPYADLDVLKQVLHVIDDGPDDPRRVPNLPYHDQLLVIGAYFDQSWQRRPRRPFAPSSLADDLASGDADQALGASLEAVAQLCSLLATGDALGQRIANALSGVETDAAAAATAIDPSQFDLTAVGRYASEPMRRALGVVMRADLNENRRVAAEQARVAQGEAAVIVESRRLQDDLRRLHLKYEQAIKLVRLHQQRLLVNVFNLGEEEMRELNQRADFRVQLLQAREPWQDRAEDLIRMAIPGGTPATDQIRTQLIATNDEWEDAPMLRQLANDDAEALKRRVADARLGVYDILEAMEIARRSLALFDSAKLKLASVKRYLPEQKREWAIGAQAERAKLKAARDARDQATAHALKRDLYLLFRDENGEANPDYPNPDAARDAAAAAAAAADARRLASNDALRTLRDMESNERSEERDAKRREYERKYLAHLPVRAEWLEWMRTARAARRRVLVEAWAAARNNLDELTDAGLRPTDADALKLLREEQPSKFDPAQTPGCVGIKKPRWWKKGFRPARGETQIDPQAAWGDTVFEEDDAWLRQVYDEYAEERQFGDAHQPQFQPRSDPLASMVEAARERRAHAESIEERMMAAAEEYDNERMLLSDVREVEANVDASIGRVGDGADAGARAPAVVLEPILDLGPEPEQGDQFLDPPLQANQPEADPQLRRTRRRTTIATRAAAGDAIAEPALEGAAEAEAKAEAATGSVCFPPPPALAERRGPKAGAATQPKAEPQAAFAISSTLGQCMLEGLLEQLGAIERDADDRFAAATATREAAATRVADDERVLSDALPYAVREGPNADVRMRLEALNNANRANRAARPFGDKPPFSAETRYAGGWRAAYHDYVRGFVDLVVEQDASGAARLEAQLAAVPLTPAQWRRSERGRGPYPPRRPLPEHVLKPADAAPCPSECPSAAACRPPCAEPDARGAALLAGEEAFLAIAGPWSLYGFDFAPRGPTAVIAEPVAD